MEENKSYKNVLILGTDQWGLMAYYAFKNDPSTQNQVVGFIDLYNDENELLEGLIVHPIKDITKRLIKEKSIEEIVIAIQNCETVALINVVSKLLDIDISLKIIPPVANCNNGFIEMEQIKNVTIDDLMLREPLIEFSPTLLNQYENQIILITGAAGSIGSELIRKLTKFNCKQLILIDNAESALFNVQQELFHKGIKNFESIIADIRDYNRMDQLFNQFKPKIVFHAAAYKHVPLMEDHPYEAVNVNIKGTKNIANLSVKHCIEKFVLISTDKAVNPTNVMGASKRIAELYINSLKEKGQTKFITTRFGNVMASNGSVIPLFNEQIKSGGPISVTHREIERYFMTISEACHLILEAGSMGNGGEIFVFEMGNPIRVYDLAVMMIKLSDARFTNNIPIKITGLRPGEKINEELFTSEEHAKTTYHTKIKVAQTRVLPIENVQTKILELCEKAPKIQNLELVALIKKIVPEYVSNNSKFEVLDNKN